MSFACSTIGLSKYVAPPGSLNDEASVLELRKVLEPLIAGTESDIVFDFTNVALISSTAIEVLLDAQDNMLRNGAGIRTANLSPVLKDVFRVTGIRRYFADLDDDVEHPARPADTRLLEPVPLGERLLRMGLVTEQQLAEAVEVQRDSGKRLGQVLVEQALIDETQLNQALAQQFGVEAIALRQGAYDAAVARQLSFRRAQQLGCLPMFRIRDTVVLAVPDPQAVPVIDQVASELDARIRVVVATRAEIADTLKVVHDRDDGLDELIGGLDVSGDLEVIEHTVDDVKVIDELASGSPVVNLVNGLVQKAVASGASDIHIEPSRKSSRVRYRVDGVLHEVMNVPLDVHPAIVSRLKVLANLDIAERRLPQDGRIQVQTRGRVIDLRFSSLPGIFGEKVVLRLLDRERSLVDLDELGMSTDNVGRFRSLLARSHGLILVTGPTGSGKTTTLYAAIRHLTSVEKSIVTIEDPVEYQLDLINQNQVNPRIELTFATLLKHVLRQDPDIIMVGEIRERETAEIAVQAALTGHLVLSTLHTNDSVGAITRMLDMGIEPFLLSSALSAVVAQRLVRTVCDACKTSFVAPKDALAAYGVPADTGIRLVRGRGCTECFDSGYRGRLAIHELLECGTSTQRLMMNNPSREDLGAHIRELGVKTLMDAGIAQALAGRTTVEEVARVVSAA